MQTITDGRWGSRFFTIWVGQQLSIIGSTVGSFALIWWLTTTTGSAIVLTTASMIALGPVILLGPFIGTLIDRWNRRMVIVISDGFIALISLWLAYLFWSGAMEVWHVYIVLVGNALGSTFHGPAMLASTTLMVPKQHLTRISGLNMTMRGAQGIIGPPLGALLITLLPLHNVMLIDVGTALFAILPLLFLAIPQPENVSKEPVTFRSIISETKAGLLFIGRWKGLVALLAILLMAKIFIMPARALKPLLVLEHFGKGAIELGWLSSLSGMGIVLGGLLLGAWGGFKRKVVTILFGMAGLGFALALTGFAPIRYFWMVLIGSFLMGLMIPISNAPFTAIVQTTIPAAMQGRFFATFGSLSALSTPIGLAIAGPVSNWMGVAFWYQLGGLACLVICAIGFFLPSLMKIEKHKIRLNSAGAGEASQEEL
jgi:MFS transporter, DHA3 family, macrolide efflux protein